MEVLEKTYTLASAAWSHGWRRDTGRSKTDDELLFTYTLRYEGYISGSLRWFHYEDGREPRTFLKLEVHSDGWDYLHVIAPVLAELQTDSNVDVATPAEAVRVFSEHGWSPSEYHNQLPCKRCGEPANQPKNYCDHK